ncbi:30S ribosomal protein S4e [Candidatus Woesearchaeota archaeon]|nr:30S ribosomal protein S4e [Candidatus Woesearchaeota archaeon]
MVKNHLKRLAVPRTWDIDKKKNKFIMRSNPGGHRQDESVPLVVLFRDMLKKAKTVSEVKYILNNKIVLKNGVKQTDVKAPVGLFDVITLPEIKASYRIILNKKGKICAVGIDSADANKLPLKIRDKTLVKGGKVQLNFSNGGNMIIDKNNYSTGDVIVVDIDTKKMSAHIKLEKGCVVYLTGGKHSGITAAVEDIKGDKLVFKVGPDEIFETSKEYAFAIGKDKPIIKFGD